MTPRCTASSSDANGCSCARGDDLLDGHRTDARQRLELLGRGRVQVDQPATAARHRAADVAGSAGCGRLRVADARHPNLLPILAGIWARLMAVAAAARSASAP